MKKTLLVVITTLAALLALTATAERKIWMYSHSGNHVSLPVTDLDSIGFETPTVLELSEYNKKLDSKGGSFTLGITTNQTWKAEVNNPIAVTLSKTTGTGSDDISVTAMENTGSKSYSAIVTVTAKNGMYKQLILTVAGTEPGSLKIEPEVKNLASTGGRFPLNRETDQAWTATVSDPSALTLSKSSGTGSATINVSAVSNADTKPYTEYVTVELADGTKKQLTVNVSVNDEYVLADLEPWGTVVAKKGGTIDANVSSNTYWSVECNKGWARVSPNLGEFNSAIKIEVDANPNGYAEYASLTFYAMGGNTSSYSIIREGDRISVSPTEKEIWYEGGTIDMAVTSNTDWTASSSQSWATLATSSGSGNGTIAVTVSENTSLKTDTAVVTLTTAFGIKTSTTIVRLGVEKCNASDYPQVTIGAQVWMAENYRCSKYDTESEAYKEGRYTIPTLKRITYTPYFTDASDKSKWNTKYGDYSGNLTDAQIKKFGYLYNWAAAVGVADGEKQTTAFSGNRQGICPNGWHVPSRAEWQTLCDYIYKDKSLTSEDYEVCKYLKTTSGWYSGDSYYEPGLDTYGFAALPTGVAVAFESSSVYDVGHFTRFWTATPAESRSDSAHSWYLSNGDIVEDIGDRKDECGLSVRCLRD
ncbi:MAG: hypothetical protein MJ009_02285 [Paludibacteraceae bacterium]|nr:hypothetical protein [Paludibacteraceae bacterium]